MRGYQFRMRTPTVAIESPNDLKILQVPVGASGTPSPKRIPARQSLDKIMPKPNEKRPLPADGPQQPGEIDVDVDDAQIEEPKDDAFEQGDPNKSPRLKK